MRRGVMVILLIMTVVLVLAGCGDLRERAKETEARIANAEETAQIAERAAAQNMARILELEDRVEALERQVEELHPEAEAEADS